MDPRIWWTLFVTDPRIRYQPVKPHACLALFCVSDGGRGGPWSGIECNWACYSVRVETIGDIVWEVFLLHSAQQPL